MPMTQLYLNPPPPASPPLEKENAIFKLPLAHSLYSLIKKLIRITKRNPVVVVVGRVVAITFIKCIKPENVTNCMIHAVYVPGLYVDYKKKKNMSQ